VDESVILNLVEFLDTKKKWNLFFDEKYSSEGLIKKLEEMKHINTTVLASKKKKKGGKKKEKK